MPIYTYTCNKCSKETDFLVGMTATSQNLQCSECGSKGLSRVYNAFGIVGSSRGAACGSCSGGDCSSCSH